MRNRLRIDINNRLDSYEKTNGLLSGIIETAPQAVLVEQIIDSVNRVEYVHLKKMRPISPKRADPNEEEFFDPLLGAIFHYQNGNLNEAFWLVFLFTHFGRHAKGKWRFAREFYGRLGGGGLWDWDTVASNPNDVENWISSNHTTLSRPGCAFGNHRKYESMSKLSETVLSYISWVGKTKNHLDLIAKVSRLHSGDPKKMFHSLYLSMNQVCRFGRTARFDYLAMVGKINIAAIEPGLVYIANATGPKTGAKILFGDPAMSNLRLEEKISTLNKFLGFGMQVIEDSICNWQKNIHSYERFKD